MAAYLLVLFCLIAGGACARLKALPANASVTLNRFIIFFSLPAFAFQNVHRLAPPAGVTWLVLAPWLLFILGVPFYWAVARASRWNRRTLGTLIVVGGLGNTSFLGFPLIEACFGPKGIESAVLTDQLGSFLVLSTLGIGCAAFFSGTKVSRLRVARKIVFFPPFIALLLGIALRPFTIPVPLDELLGQLAATLIPLAVFSVGLALKLDTEAAARNRGPLAAGIGYKMFLGPLALSLLYAALGLHGDPIRITLVETTMAPMITAGIVATEYGLDAELANLLLGIGIPLSLVTVPLAEWLIRALIPA